ncbi:MAG: MerR family redox-sensitive transcriptional activator SoxR [Candidatus Aldehydirespiratoraceae bacterium]|jgi:MerR family redox-sensitive transcriptional activator SoxR
MNTLAIGEVATATGLAVSAVRYYDEIGVISTADRVGGKRRFSESTVGRVNFIRRSQDAGFSLDEIREILDDTSGEWHQIVEAKIAETITRRAELDTLLSLLEAIQECGCEAVATCPSRGDW